MNTAKSASVSAPSESTKGASQVVPLVLAWTAVGVPLAWGVAETLRKTFALFQ